MKIIKPILENIQKLTCSPCSLNYAYFRNRIIWDRFISNLTKNQLYRVEITSDLLDDNPGVVGTVYADNNGYLEIKTRPNIEWGALNLLKAHLFGHFLSFKHKSYSYQLMSDKKEIKEYEFNLPADYEGKLYSKSHQEAHLEAQLIAEEIVMPKDNFQLLVNSKVPLDVIANEFNVPRHAVVTRLNRLFPLAYAL